MDAVQIGDLAPDFTLPATSGQAVRLSDASSNQNVLLAFFPAAFTDVCTAEMCAFTEDIDRFSVIGTTVLGISVDSIPALVEFQKKHGITIPLLSDVRREVCRAYGAFNERFYCASRAYFIIDQSRIIQWAHREEDLDQTRGHDELLTELRRLRGAGRP